MNLITALIFLSVTGAGVYYYEFYDPTTTTVVPTGTTVPFTGTTVATTTPTQAIVADCHWNLNGQNVHKPPVSSYDGNLPLPYNQDVIAIGGDFCAPGRVTYFCMSDAPKYQVGKPLFNLPGFVACSYWIYPARGSKTPSANSLGFQLPSPTDMLRVAPLIGMMQPHS